MDEPCPPCAPRPELRADAARNRAKVLDVARRRLRDGDLGLAMNTISKEAGVGVGTVYRHFPSRVALLEAMATDAFTRMVDGARYATSEPDPEVGLHRLMQGGLSCLLGDSALAELMSSPVFPGFTARDNMALAEELHTSVTTLVDRARAAGVVREDVTADDLRRLVVSLHSAASCGATDEACLRRFVDIMIKGLRPDVEPSDPAAATRSAPPG